MNWRALSGRIYFFGFLFVVGLGTAFYFVLGQGARSSVTEELLSKQQLLVRAEASNITSFFQVFGDSVAVLAQLKTITDPNSAIWELDTFTEQWRDSGVVDGVVLIDAHGILKLNSNIEGTHEAGVSLADRDYFLWAKTHPEAGEYFISEPVISRLGASKGKPIVAVASPVYKNGTFMGVLVAAVELDGLSRHYLKLMQVSDATDTFLIEDSGVLLFGDSFSADASLNIFDYLKTDPFSGSRNLSDALSNALSMKGEGKLKISYMDPKSGDVEPHLLAYSPIILGNQRWLLVMASPVPDLWNLAVPMYVRLIALMVLVALTIFIFGMVVVKEIKTPKKD